MQFGTEFVWYQFLHVVTALRAGLWYQFSGRVFGSDFWYVSIVLA